MILSQQSPSIEKRLIVFTRCPEAGKCKTRLIPALDADGALAIHEALVRHTMSWIQTAVDEGITVEVRYAGSALNRLRALCSEMAERTNFRPQLGTDLGQRLAEASEAAFQEGATRIAIIGTDCPDLDWNLVSSAFAHLDDSDLVLGPAADGGYYLIAARKPCGGIFDGITWSESSVSRDTLSKAQELQMSVVLLPTLSDVDRIEDVCALNLETFKRSQLLCLRPSAMVQLNADSRDQ